LVVLPLREPRGQCPRTAKRRDASRPPLGPDPKRLVYCSLHDVSLPDVAIRAVSVDTSSRSRDRTGRITIGEPANRIGFLSGLPLRCLRPSRRLVGREGVEPSTSRLSGVRSNHLSYRPQSMGRSCPRGCRRSPVAPKARRRRSGRRNHEGGGAYRDRTGDLMLAKHALSQLS
jgi:hypothetical protein